MAFNVEDGRRGLVSTEQAEDLVDNIALRGENTFDGGEAVFKDISNFLDETPVVAIYLA
jgi:hypothetical protein